MRHSRYAHSVEFQEASEAAPAGTVVAASMGTVVAASAGTVGSVS